MGYTPAISGLGLVLGLCPVVMIPLVTLRIDSRVSSLLEDFKEYVLNFEISCHMSIFATWLLDCGIIAWICNKALIGRTGPSYNLHRYASWFPNWEPPIVVLSCFGERLWYSTPKQKLMNASHFRVRQSQISMIYFILFQWFLPRLPLSAGIFIPGFVCCKTY